VRVVLDPELDALGRGAIGEARREGDRHVDAGRDTARGEELAVLHEALAHVARAELLELGGVGPMRRRAASLEETGRREDEPSRADRSHDLGRRRRRPQVALDRLVRHGGHGAGPARDDDGPGTWDVVQPLLGSEGEAGVRRHRLHALAHHHGAKGRGQGPQHLKGTDEVEEREVREQQQGNRLLASFTRSGGARIAGERCPRRRRRQRQTAGEETPTQITARQRFGHCDLRLHRTQLYRRLSVASTAK
jgi:hypothetical protein